MAAHQLGALGFGVGGGLGSVLHPEGHGAGARAVLEGEFMDMPGRAAVEHDVDIVLLEQEDFLGTMLGGFGEAHHVEQLAQLLDALGVGGGELDEFESVGTDGIVLFDLGHGVHPASSLFLLNGPPPVQAADDMGDAFISPRGGAADKPSAGPGTGPGAGFLATIPYAPAACMANARSS